MRSGREAPSKFAVAILVEVPSKIKVRTRKEQFCDLSKASFTRFFYCFADRIPFVKKYPTVILRLSNKFTAMKNNASVASSLLSSSLRVVNTRSEVCITIYSAFRSNELAVSFNMHSIQDQATVIPSI